MKSITLYTSYLLILIIINIIYKYVLNKNNKIEYYFFTNDKTKYKTLKYCTIFLNIVMFIYLRFVFINLLNSYKTIKWNKS